MKYYKAKGDWVVKDKKGNLVQLIQDELFTITEIKRKGLSFTEDIFEPVDLKRNQTHYVFGVRKENIGISY